MFQKPTRNPQISNLKIKKVTLESNSTGFVLLGEFSKKKIVRISNIAELGNYEQYQKGLILYKSPI